MFEDESDAPTELGSPENWQEFAERMQRQVGKGARVFVCQQVGVEATLPPIIMVLSASHIRRDLLGETARLILLAEGAK